MNSAIPYGLSDPGSCHHPTELVDAEGPENSHRELVFEQIVGNSPALKQVEGDKVAYLQFLEHSYGTTGSFKTGGKTRFHSDP